MRDVMANSEQKVVRLTVECVDLPPHDWGGHREIWLGIQRGKDVVQEVQLPAEQVTFEGELRVSGDMAPNFLGPYAHGTVQERFLYLCWGYRHLGSWAGFRRVKIPLTGLTFQSMVSGHLHVRIRCTDAKGGPICATIKGDAVVWSSPS
jgi:hypothetical protein